MGWAGSNSDVITGKEEEEEEAREEADERAEVGPARLTARPMMTNLIIASAVPGERERERERSLLEVALV